MQLIPGFGKTPALPPAPPPPPTKDDPAIAAAKNDLRLSEKKRRGRSATILTDQRAGLGEAEIARPEARAAKLLGE